MWRPFLSSQRIGSRRKETSRAEHERSEFHRDYDRIIFSSAFRRMADKTQVVPFPKSDYTRQRLTHSLEVSCVGRSLATSVYEFLKDDIRSLASQGDFEAIVAAACLAHDIGNPPFGHFGEKAIQDWGCRNLNGPAFSELTAAQRADICRFEGNAQSFRVLTRLQMSDRHGGMRLTAATLGALIKYPCASDMADKGRYHKHGYLQDDASLFAEVFRVAGRQPDPHGQYSRHPLALLTEAADDICYAIVDIEDGTRAGLIPLDEALDVLEGISTGCTGSAAMPETERLSMGRALVINTLVTHCAAVFHEQCDKILDGTFEGSLIQHGPSADQYARAGRLARERVFRSPGILELEAAGYRAINGLMEILAAAALTDHPNAFDRHVRNLCGLSIRNDTPIYHRLLACTDYVSGMTDRYCIELFRKLSGHALGA